MRKIQIKQKKEPTDDHIRFPRQQQLVFLLKFFLHYSGHARIIIKMSEFITITNREVNI